jgi:plasmid stabilization system protein ParE
LARVVLRPSFLEDYEHQVEYLAVHADPVSLERLLSAITEARQRVEDFPEAYPIDRETIDYVVRRVALRTLPYLILYVHLPRKPIRRVWFVRLFHHRQARPIPDTAWPW